MSESVWKWLGIVAAFAVGLAIGRSSAFTTIENECRENFSFTINGTDSDREYVCRERRKP